MNIKSFAFCLIMTAFSSLGFAQKTAKKTINLPNESKELYTLVDNSYSGLYQVKNQNGDVITRGNYLNDKRVGNWYFLNSDNSLFLRYNYDEKKVLFLDAKSIAFASINVKSDNENESKLASVPLPLISIEQYITLLTPLVKEKIPSEIKKANKSLKVDIIADIDENGKATYTAQYLAGGQKRTQHFDLLGQKYSIDWIPASLNNKKLSSQFSFNAELSFPQQEVVLQQKRIKWD